MLSTVEQLVPRWRRQRLSAREVDHGLRRVVLAAALLRTDPAHWDSVDAGARTWTHVWDRVRQALAARDRLLAGPRSPRERLRFVRTLHRAAPRHYRVPAAQMPALVALPGPHELARLVEAQRRLASAASADLDESGCGADDDDDDAASACTATDTEDPHTCTPGSVLVETPGGFITGDNTPMF